MSNSMLSLTLPTDRSALSIVGHRSNTKDLQDGDVFAKDCYVYRDGQRLRKYFGHRSGWNHFWEPILDDLPRLEKDYQKLKVRTTRFWNKINSILEEIVASGHITNHYSQTVHYAHARALHEPDEREGWWQYRTYISSDTNGLAYSFDWIKKPDVPVNLELGQRLYKLDFRRNRFMAGVRSVLEEAIERYIRNNLPMPENYFDERRYDVSINGRTYVYGAKLNQYKYPDIFKLMWEEDRIHKVVL